MDLQGDVDYGGFREVRGPDCVKECDKRGAVGRVEKVCSLGLGCGRVDPVGGMWYWLCGDRLGSCWSWGVVGVVGGRCLVGWVCWTLR